MQTALAVQASILFVIVLIVTLAIGGSRIVKLLASMGSGPTREMARATLSSVRWMVLALCAFVTSNVSYAIFWPGDSSQSSRILIGLVLTTNNITINAEIEVGLGYHAL